METLKAWDYACFTWVNRDSANAFFDFIMPWMREAKIWIPLYLLLVGLLVVRYKKHFWIPLVFAVAAVASADRISSGLFKPGFERLRPCHDPELSETLVLRKLDGNCGGQYGFISSHAANHMALALFVFLLYRRRKRSKYFASLFLWAFAISYAQVYVGVHFPGDVLVGMSLGLLLGWMAYYLCQRILEKLNYEF
ncbi:MAG: phosphatase PAP2 family protein [Bacteroidetes bacterium]|nr:MAG: phosphatase PAP2 family protein [Bacteroidota bacterium]